MRLCSAWVAVAGLAAFGAPSVQAEILKIDLNNITATLADPENYDSEDGLYAYVGEITLSKQLNTQLLHLDTPTDNTIIAGPIQPDSFSGTLVFSASANGSYISSGSMTFSYGASSFTIVLGAPSEPVTWDSFAASNNAQVTFAGAAFAGASAWNSGIGTLTLSGFYPGPDGVAHDVSVDAVINPVPEVQTLALLSVGVAALMRRRNKSRSVVE